MARKTFDEFCYMLEQQDPNLNLVIVEGPRDLFFWQRLFPVSDRKDSEIWSIDAIDDPDDEGGSRGRLIRLAKNLEKEGFASRVTIFADADFDRVLKVKNPNNVCLTDFRDLEGYAYNTKGCEHFAFVFNNHQLVFSDLEQGLEESLQYVSSIRLTAPLDGEHLKVNDSMETLKSREYEFSGGVIAIKKKRFLQRVLQKSGVGLTDLDRICDRVDDLSKRFNTGTSKDHIHGKDLVKLLSIYFDCSPSEMGRHVWGALNFCMDDIRRLPAIKKTLGFLTT